MNKTVIHQFDPAVYPLKLWVSINPSIDYIAETFYGITDKMERVDINERYQNDNYFSVASTWPVANKKDGQIGLLVPIWKPKQINIGIICHESTHCTDFMCERLGITSGSFENGEAYAYLASWIAKCIEDVVKHKKQ